MIQNLEEREDFFSLKLVYDGNGTLVYAALDGQPMEKRGGKWLP